MSKGPNLYIFVNTCDFLGSFNNTHIDVATWSPNILL